MCGPFYQIGKSYGNGGMVDFLLHLTKHYHSENEFINLYRHWAARLQGD